jgi:hypothetical protein
LVQSDRFRIAGHLRSDDFVPGLPDSIVVEVSIDSEPGDDSRQDGAKLLGTAAFSGVTHDEF